MLVAETDAKDQERKRKYYLYPPEPPQSGGCSRVEHSEEEIELENRLPTSSNSVLYNTAVPQRV